jgi:rod shape-determining protein MreC
MFLKKRFPLFIFFVILIFAILTYQGIKGGIDTSEFPFLNYPLIILEMGISTTVDSIKNFFHSYILIVGKEAENRRLIKELERERQKYNEYLETEYENERLRALLKLKRHRPDYVTSAEVIARDPTNWFHVLWINKGRDNGISDDMVAVTPRGIVGRIHKVLDDVSTIILITDVNSSVAVRLQSSRVEGILEGSGSDKCYLKYIPQDVDVRIGDRVITSGLDGIYPEGLEVGYVTNIEKKGEDFFQLIEVTTSQPLNAVEEVSILKR